MFLAPLQLDLMTQFNLPPVFVALYEQGSLANLSSACLTTVSGRLPTFSLLLLVLLSQLVSPGKQ